VPHATRALIPRPQHKSSDNPPPDVVLRERQLHPVVIRAPASETFIFRIRRQNNLVAQLFQAFP
jgi:hypothetical protein